MGSFNKLVLYSHISSGNRGCEATARTTAQILGFSKEDTFLFSNDMQDELDCNTDRYARIISITKVKGLSPAASVVPRILNKSRIDKNATSKYLYKKYLSMFDSNTLALATGGDLYCYDNTNIWLDYLNREIQKRKATTVLWACSIEKSRMTKDLIRDLQKYTYIMARESITYENLIASGLKDNVKLYPDPAFLLEKEQIDISNWTANGDLVGINISSRTNGGFDTNHIFFRNTIALIKHIIENTNMSILLIPHVYWENENDLILLRKLWEIFKNSNRVFLVDAKMNCCQLKYIISKCRFYVGSRTHSVIAAYSSMVPTLALGYSIKSVGIAKDIFGEEKDMVLSTGRLVVETELIWSFERLREREEWIKSQLQLKIPEYEKALKEQGEYIQTISGR